MKLNERSIPSCLVVLACGSWLSGCAGADGSESDLGQTAQALVDTQSRSNEPDSARATCTVFTFADRIHDDIAEIDCDLTDSLADSHSVYVEWSQDGFDERRLENHDGAGSTLFVSDALQNLDGSFQRIRWHVCTDVQFGGDDCSDDVSYEL